METLSRTYTKDSYPSRYTEGTSVVLGIISYNGGHGKGREMNCWQTDLN